MNEERLACVEIRGERNLRGGLKEVRDADYNPIASFEYDVYGRRVTKYIAETGTTTHFYYDGWRVIEEYTGNGDNQTLAARNVRGLYPDEIVVRTSIGDGKDCYPVLTPLYSPLGDYDANREGGLDNDPGAVDDIAKRIYESVSMAAGGE